MGLELTPSKWRENPDYEMQKEQILFGIGKDRSGLNNPDYTKFFTSKNNRSESIHQIDPDLAKTQINRIRIDWSLLHL